MSLPDEKEDLVMKMLERRTNALCLGICSNDFSNTTDNSFSWHIFSRLCRVREEIHLLQNQTIVLIFVHSSSEIITDLGDLKLQKNETAVNCRVILVNNPRLSDFSLSIFGIPAIEKNYSETITPIISCLSIRRSFLFSFNPYRQNEIKTVCDIYRKVPLCFQSQLSIVLMKGLCKEANNEVSTEDDAIKATIISLTEKTETEPTVVNLNSAAPM